MYPSSRLQWLSVEGNTIRDDVGPLFLVGCNSRGTARNPLIGWDDFWSLAEYDAKTIKGYGFNVVRLAATYWARLEISQSPDEFVYDMEYLEHMKTAIRAFNEEGIYVILDMHTYETIEGMAPLANFVPIADNGISFASEFFKDTGSTSAREHLKRLWLLLSDTFKDWSGIAGYDILNEPHKSGPESFQEIADHWWDIVDYVTAAIRANGDNHVIFVNFSPSAQSAQWMSRKLNDTNTVYEPHWYRGLGGNDFQDVINSDIEYLRDTFGSGDTQISTKMAYFDVPFIVGELCCTYHELSYEKEVWLNNSLTVFRESPTMQGWTYWVYWNNGNDQSTRWQELLVEYAADKPTQVHFY